MYDNNFPEKKKPNGRLIFFTICLVVFVYHFEETGNASVRKVNYLKVEITS